MGDPRRLAASASAAASVEICPPNAIERAHERLGTHPDLVERLWDDLGGKLPKSCNWIVFGTPVLAHPKTGVIFGLAGGTVYALRLPKKEFDEALAPGAKQTRHFPAYPEINIAASDWDLRDLGPGWVFGEWHKREVDWRLAAFNAAAFGGIVWL